MHAYVGFWLNFCVCLFVFHSVHWCIFICLSPIWTCVCPWVLANLCLCVSWLHQLCLSLISLAWMLQIATETKPDITSISTLSTSKSHLHAHYMCFLLIKNKMRMRFQNKSEKQKLGGGKREKVRKLERERKFDRLSDRKRNSTKNERATLPHVIELSKSKRVKDR